MMVLYQFERTWGSPNLSHFCCKTETYLRMAGIEYDIKTTLPLFAPKGKLPYIEDGDLKIADSRFIIRHLKATYKDLDEGLTPAESALSLAMQRLIEEHLFWVTMYSRWQYTDANWQVTKKAIFGVMPPGIRDVAAVYYRHKIKRQILGHGTGRLKKLEAAGLVTRRAYQQKPARYEYFLTEKGESLRPVLVAIISWTQEHYPDTQVFPAVGQGQAT